MLWLFLDRETDVLSAPHRVLHFAPESGIADHLAQLSNLDYVSGDLNPARAMEVMDITAIPRPEGSFDVPDDRTALNEMLRVLRPGGTAYMQHPVDPDRATTYEDPSITAPKDRLRAFDQDDHVRVYGTDFKERVAAAGFDIEVRCYDSELSPAERARFALAVDPGLQRAGDIYVCRKPAARAAT